MLSDFVRVSSNLFHLIFLAAINNQPIPLKIELPYVAISTMSTVTVTTNVVLNMQEDFYVESNKIYTTTISPSTPKFYYYNFPLNDSKSTSNVKLEVNSTDDICMMASIQNYSVSSCHVPKPILIRKIE